MKDEENMEISNRKIEQLHVKERKDTIKLPKTEIRSEMERAII